MLPIYSLHPLFKIVDSCNFMFLHLCYLIFQTPPPFPSTFFYLLLSQPSNHQSINQNLRFQLPIRPQEPFKQLDRMLNIISAPRLPDTVHAQLRVAQI